MVHGEARKEMLRFKSSLVGSRILRHQWRWLYSFLVANNYGYAFVRLIALLNEARRHCGLYATQGK